MAGSHTSASDASITLGHLHVSNFLLGWEHVCGLCREISFGINRCPSPNNDIEHVKTARERSSKKICESCLLTLQLVGQKSWSRVQTAVEGAVQ